MTRDFASALPRGLGLALIGARGTGKSTVGRLLARRVHRRFLDLDPEIEARAGRSIRAIFTDWGEPAFRDWEERTLAAVTEANPGAILATGGGAVLRPVNRQRIRAFGFVVWLTADPDELARRLEADPRGLSDRPALTTAGTLGEIAQVLRQRSPLYRELAGAVVETGGKSPDDVVEAILACWTSPRERPLASPEPPLA
jgi:shikimate kinase